MDWPLFLTGLAAVLTSLATLVTAWQTHKAVRTPNGTSIGTMVEEAVRTPSGRTLGTVVESTNQAVTKDTPNA